MDISPVQYFNTALVQQRLIDVGKTHVVASGDDTEVMVVRCRRRQHGTFHSHTDVELIFVLEGTLILHLIDRSQEFKAGEVIVIPALLIHATSSLDDAVKMVVRRKVSPGTGTA